MYLAKIVVTLRKSILDPQGKAIHHALASLQLKSVSEVRIGKFIEVHVDCASAHEVHRTIEESCKKLLANPVMEDYSFTIEKI